jgi:glycerol-3-phosphate O-acyltransferase
MIDEVTRAVLAREEVARYMKASGDHVDREAKERIFAYLDELRTTQRYTIYRVLKHPLYPILRKIERRIEHGDLARRGTEQGRVLYISNHKSHLDYLVEPLALEDLQIRPPVIAAGINLFGGPLGLLHRHVTGAIPIRRDARDPAYLVTLKAYIAELLKRHDLMFYLEGGRSYTGEMKAAKTGLIHAALQAEGREEMVIVPTAVSYDLVLEDGILARQGSKRRQRPFSRELTEMVGSAVGYESRSFTTFGTPIPMKGWDPHSRRDVMALAHATRDAIGRLYKVVPTAIVAVCVRPAILRSELRQRIADLVGRLDAAGANLDVSDPATIEERGVASLENRGVLVGERHRVRVRDRFVLRYYAKTLEHLLNPSKRTARSH